MDDLASPGNSQDPSSSSSDALRLFILEPKLWVNHDNDNDKSAQRLSWKGLSTPDLTLSEEEESEEESGAKESNPELERVAGEEGRFVEGGGHSDEETRRIVQELKEAAEEEEEEVLDEKSAVEGEMAPIVDEAAPGADPEAAESRATRTPTLKMADVAMAIKVLSLEDEEEDEEADLKPIFDYDTVELCYGDVTV